MNNRHYNVNIEDLIWSFLQQNSFYEGLIMVYRDKVHNTKGFVEKDKIASLVQAVKILEFQNIQDVLEANQLLSLIFDEWYSLNEKYKKKLYERNIINKKIYAQYEAEGQIIIGLAAFLNEKMLLFVSKLLESNTKIY